MSNPLEGAILQRDKQTYAIVPRTPAGMLTPEILDTISYVCKKYEIPIIKITSGQRIALVGMREEQVQPVWDELQWRVGRATELCVHYVQACPGTAVCKLGLQDSLGMGLEIENMFHEKPYPAKVKIGVSGCPMCCGESYVRDVGLVGTKHGWNVIVGGNSGGRPRIGDVLAENLSTEDARALVDKFMDYYREGSGKRLRVARFVEKVGIDAVRAAVL
ncbi:NAD(P)/FAD-dependent oxidoreductase [Desulfovibrio psychrotolerans]|uniref:Sulfite reductase, assimilatory-type n=1 Tax=Desulfovibrio psychrotolerans TaxID=415242 RepID=A0A7J0BXH2_9BACT|nr:NAD(P)/FAD-dependent oxidoreductase [Desulfovibrio psychrotolerans]GFM38397.1 sulfite reductase, assimilatory-type [Desulfovibrio psychrotolerans]